MPRLDVLQIGEVAKRVGVSVRTIRYYEERGLLAPPIRTSGGVRLYGDADVSRLHFIRRLRILGMSLHEIEEALGRRCDHQGRQERVAHSLELLLMEQKRAEEHQALMGRLLNEVEESLANIRVCATCSAEECPEDCPHGKYLL